MTRWARPKTNFRYGKQPDNATPWEEFFPDKTKDDKETETSNNFSPQKNSKKKKINNTEDESLVDHPISGKKKKKLSSAKIENETELINDAETDDIASSSLTDECQNVIETMKRLEKIFDEEDAEKNAPKETRVSDGKKKKRQKRKKVSENEDEIPDKVMKKSKKMRLSEDQELNSKDKIESFKGKDDTVENVQPKLNRKQKRKLWIQQKKRESEAEIPDKKMEKSEKLQDLKEKNFSKDEIEKVQAKDSSKQDGNDSKQKGSKKEIRRKKLEEKRKQKGIMLLSEKEEKKIYNIKKSLRKKQFSPDQIKEIIRRERRSAELRIRKELEKACYHCRKSGHSVADCPEVQKDSELGMGICFKCGSTEHKSRDCQAKVSSGKFPFAKCFVCGETGHISRDCSKNKHGLYPKGGCCNICGSVQHLRKDCPKLPPSEDSSMKAFRQNKFASADAEDFSSDVKAKSPSKPKIVNF